ncbi:MAG: translation initiation factor IF-3 [Actinomycetota bacterium]|nr:translation initiation factor IF-3 [Actinomycetota bacterium]
MSAGQQSGGFPIAKEPRVNEKIRAKEVRLVDTGGGQVGIKGIEEARWLADQLGLDLVEVAPEARPPVVRLMDYGKFKYEASVKAREARKNQARTVIKEVQFRPKIASSDFDVKRKRVEKFLRNGDKVKVVMRFRGREVTHPELGRDILLRLEAAVEDMGTVETMPRLDGRQMTMVLAPLRRQKMREDSGSETSSDTSTAEVSEVPAEKETVDPIDEAKSATSEQATDLPAAEAGAPDEPEEE